MPIKIDWIDNNADEDGHRIYLSPQPMDPAALPPPHGEVGPDVTTYTAADADADQPAYIIVSAVKGTAEALSQELHYSPSAPVPFDDWRVQGIAQTWWIRPLSARYGQSHYISGISRHGDYKIARIAPDGSMATATVASWEGDDHNAASVTRLPDGRILAMYTRHGRDNRVRYRITAAPDDISAWAEEQGFDASDRATYTQVWVDSQDRVHVFYRVTTLTWAHRYTDDGAATWSPEKVFLSSSDRPYIATAQSEGNVDLLRLAIAGHPIDSSDHNIYFGEIDLLTGNIAPPGGAAVANLYDASTPLHPSDLEVAFAAGGANSRMFDLGGGVVPQILFATFSNTQDAQYREARRVDGAWAVSPRIADAGPPIENPVGANYYFAGMAATRNPDEVYLVRRDWGSANWLMERYIFSAEGWVHADTPLEQDWREFKELYRPMVPLNASSRLPVTVMRGEYSSYGTTAGHDVHLTDVVFDPDRVPEFTGQVLYEQSFAGLAAGEPIPGWEVLTKSSGVIDEAFTAEDVESYFGGVYGRIYHRQSLAVLWGVSNSNAYNVAARADFRMEKGVPGVFGLIARWVDVSNRVEFDASWGRDEISIKERIAGTTHTTTAPLSGVSIDEAVTLEMLIQEQSCTGRVYRNGILLAEVQATLVASSSPGKFGLKGSSYTSASETEIQVQRVLFTTG